MTDNQQPNPKRTIGHTAAIVAVGVLTVAFNPLWCALALPYVAVLGAKKLLAKRDTDPALISRPVMGPDGRPVSAEVQKGTPLG